MVWVRSFVPNEKNSADAAILSAVRAARGKLDHRTDQVVDWFPHRPQDLARALLED